MQGKYKVILVLSILVVLSVGIWVLRQNDKNKMLYQSPPNRDDTVGNEQVDKSIEDVSPTIDESQLTAKFKLTYLPSVVHVGDTVTLKIILSAVGELLDGSDIRLQFDPAFLQVQGEIEPTSLFQSFPQKSVDNTAGLIKMIAFGGMTDPLQQDEEMVTINFQTMQKGRAHIWFDFRKGSTNTSTVVQKGTSKNLLGFVDDIYVPIE